MMKKGLLKLKAGNKARTMNYTSKDGGNRVYVLTLEDSGKISDINKNNQVDITFIQDKETVSGKAEIIKDKKQTEDIFNQMIEEDNSHFNSLSDKIVLIELSF